MDFKTKRISRCYLFLLLGLLIVIFGMVGTAHAEHVDPFPSYTHYTDSGGTDTAVDPINCLFGGTYFNGYYGTPGGVLSQLETDLGSGVHNDDPAWILQYVKFQSNLGNHVWRSEHDYWDTPYIVYSVRYGSYWSSSIHTRLFRNKYATPGGSYANKNAVTAIHHEYRDGTTHVVDEDYETTEDNYLYTLSLKPGNTWWNDAIYNGGWSQNGHYSNGYMSKATLYPG